MAFSFSPGLLVTGPSIDKKPFIQEDNTIFFKQDCTEPVIASRAEERQGIILFFHMKFRGMIDTESLNNALPYILGNFPKGVCFLSTVFLSFTGYFFKNFFMPTP